MLIGFFPKISEKPDARGSRMHSRTGFLVCLIFLSGISSEKKKLHGMERIEYNDKCQDMANSQRYKLLGQVLLPIAFSFLSPLRKI